MASTSGDADTKPFFRFLTDDILQDVLTAKPKIEEEGPSTSTRYKPSKPDISLEDGQKLPKARRTKFQSETMACVPMAEIDPAYHNQQTFVAFGKNGTIHRFSARDSLFLLEPLSPLRKAAIFLSTNWGFAAFMVAVVIVNVILLSDSRMDYGFDYACTAIYIFELLLKIISRGVFIDKFTCMRNPWTWLDIIVITTSLIRPFGVFTVLQWLRVLKIIPLIGETRKSFQFMLKSLKRLPSAICLIAFFNLLFGIFGLELFMGLLTQKCIKNLPEGWSLIIAEDINAIWHGHVMNRTNWYQGDSGTEQFVCGNMTSSRHCPQGYTCLKGFGPNPDYGYTNFDNIFWATMSTSRIMMQDYIDGIYSQLVAATGTWHVLFHLLIFFLGTYGIGSFVLALLSINLFHTMDEKERLAETESEVNKNLDVSEAPTDEVKDTHIEVQSSSEVKQPETPPGNKLQNLSKNVVNYWAFEVFITSVIIIDTIGLCLHYRGFPLDFEVVLSHLSIIVCGIYWIEFILKVCAYGFKGYFRKGWNIFDFIILLQYTLQFFVSADFTANSSIFIYNPFRIFKIIPRWYTLNLYFKIVWNSLKMFWGFIAVFFVIWSFFALLGKDAFDEAYADKKGLFPGGEMPRWNFLDYTHSFTMVFRSWLGETIELVWDCMLVNGIECMIYFPIVALTGELLITTLTIGVVYTTVKTLKSAESNPMSDSTLSKIGESCCLPCSWLKRKVTSQERENVQTEEIPMKPKDDESKDTSPKSGQEPSAPPSSKEYRRKMQDCAESRALQWISIIVIIVTSVVLTLESGEDATVKTTVYVLDILFTAFFGIVALYKLVSFGPKACFKSFGWIFDLIIVMEMILHLGLNLYKATGYNFALFFFIRSLRPFMLVSRISQLEVVLRGILIELGFLRKFILVGVFIWLYFSVWGMASFSDAFYKCVDIDGSIPNSDIIRDKMNCLGNNYTWANSYSNFDNLPEGFISWSQIAGRNGWIQITSDMFDAVGIDYNFQKESAMIYFIMIFAFFVLAVFYAFSILFGVVYYHLKQDKFSALFLTKDQRALYNERNNKPEEYSISVPRPDSGFREKTYDLVSSLSFEALVLTAIFIDTAVMATDYYQMTEAHHLSIEYVRFFILLFYTLEMIMKIIGFGKFYFTRGWNPYDCFVVVFSIIGVVMSEMAENVISPYVFRMVRIFRIFQFKPLLTRARVLRSYLKAFTLVKPALWNILIFQAVLMFSYTLFGMSVFGHVKPNNFDFGMNTGLFKSFGSSFNMLFLMCSYNGFGEVLKSISNESDCDLPDLEANTYGDCGHAKWGIFFTYSFLIASFLVVLNFYFVFILEIVTQLEKGESKNVRGNGKDDKIELEDKGEEQDHVNGLQLEVVEIEDGPELQELK